MNKLLSFLILLTVSCSTKKTSKEIPQCEELISRIPYSNSNRKISYFGLRGLDLPGKNRESHSATGLIRKNNLFDDINGGSWFVNNLEFKKKVNGYGNLGFSKSNKPNWDKLWGSRINIRLDGNSKNKIPKLESQLYLPQKLKVLFKYDNSNTLFQDSEIPVSIDLTKNLTVKWNGENNTQNKVLISIKLKKPIDYKIRNGKNYSEINNGKTWTPNGYKKQIVRFCCVPDNGIYRFDQEWLRNITRGEIFWINISRKTIETTNSEEFNFIIFSDYTVKRSFVK